MAFPKLGLDDVMPFGKYKGEQIEDLIEDHPEYLAWCFDNNVVEFNNSVISKMLDRKII